MVFAYGKAVPEKVLARRQHSSAGGTHSLADIHLYRKGSDRDMSVVVRGLLLHMVWTGALLGVRSGLEEAGVREEHVL